MEWHTYYLIPIIYLIAMIVIGVMVSGKQDSRADFYVADNKMNSAVLFSTVLATVVGANTYMGFSGLVYTGGFSLIWMLVAASTSYFVLFFISGRIRKIAEHYEVFTLPDLMAERYNRPVATLTTFCSLIALIGSAGGSILGIGMILNTILGINPIVAIVVTAAITITYTTFGGLMGVALTDWAQTIIMLIGLILVILFGFQAMDPGSSVFSASLNGGELLKGVLGTEFMSTTETVTFMLVIGWVITFMPLNTVSQTQIQRIYSAKSVKSIQRISLLVALFMGVSMAFGLTLIGGIGKSLLPDLANPETILPVLSMEIINPWIGMIIVTGILGACMSTIDSNLLGAGIHVTRDLYEHRLKRKGLPIDDKKTIRLTRWTLVIIGAFSTVAAILTPSIMGLLLFTLKIFAGATFVPIMLGLFWPKANSYGAMAGIIGGGVTTILCSIMQTSIDPVILGLIVSLAGTLLFSLLFKEEGDKGQKFLFKTVTKKDYGIFAGSVVIYAAFMISINFINMWPLLIACSLIGLCVGVIALFAFVMPKKKEKVTVTELENQSN
ncbi:sodium:solute symporter family protein [Sporosarcina aquimarina]|uniref:sodium:solute symporter family protein n=1 Tax=Sporosarcina aquimarina TaxID=114975 RepID=UPI0020402CFB|nr:sodium:solute symporter family protein [Sporosarcina aquimarina]MCM3757254.1 sodium:solute symporter family protein [Sporosarcina aquimarina]